MERKQISDFPPEVMALFDRYVHGELDRRGFLDGASRFATSSMTAAAMLEALRPNFAFGQQVAKDDKRIQTSYETFDSPQGNGKIKCYVCTPSAITGKLPAVVVIHENRGLNPHIEDVTRRLATANFLAIAPDGLTTKGGYPGTEEEGVKLFGQVDRGKLNADFEVAARWLKGHASSNGKLGVVGFCYGGGVSNALAVRMGADLAAAVPFYGGQAPAADVPKIKAALMLQYAANDERVNAGWPAYEEALKANHVNYTAYIYEGTSHGFHNDTTPRYNEAAAKLAWQRTLEFFNKHLRA